jgi:tagatose 6-phosphate kinase
MILSAGLTPAWQHVLLFDSFTPGEVNRACAAHWCASGKVLNAARALSHLGGPCKALTVVGGTAGEEIRRDFSRLGIAARWIESATPTRVCTTILDTSRHQATELVPEAGGIHAAEREQFLAAYAEEASRAAVVVLIGSLPAGTPAGFYRDLVRRTPGKAILDARGPELLDALEARPFLVKPNRDELARTVGRPLTTDADLFDALREVNRRGAGWVVVTDGSRPIHVSGEDELYRIQPPAAEVVNPIGCGDCLAGGIAWALFHGSEPVDAVRHGVAAAADKLGRPLPGVVDRGRVEEIVRSIEAVRL